MAHPRKSLWRKWGILEESTNPTGAGVDGLLRPHPHGLKAEARLGSWTGDIA
jgi:hypothetical protein